MSSEPSSPTDRLVDSSVEERLIALEQASAARSAELRALATMLPAAVSRRSLLVGAARDLRGAPNKGQIVRSGARKLSRAPRVAIRRLVVRR